MNVRQTIGVTAFSILSGISTITYSENGQKATTEASCPTTESGDYTGNNPGCFDYYVMSNIWLPESCIKIKNHGYNVDPGSCKKMYSDFNPASKAKINPHGLWQNAAKGPHPSYCTKEPFDFEALPLEVRRELNTLYPDTVRDLPAHEWEKHGTCDGTSQAEYFQKLIDVNKKTSAAGQLVSDNIGGSVPYQALVEAFGGEDSATLFCNKYDMNGERQYLAEVFTYWSKDLTKIKGSSNSNCNKNEAIYIRPMSEFLSISDWKTRFNKQFASPISVGFDIDDTVLMSSPGFYYLKEFKDFDIKKNESEFWSWMNNGLDEMSAPKISGKEIVDFHKNRGNQIYFITKRKRTDKESVTEILNQALDIEGNRAVIFSDLGDKTPFILENNIRVYYGDSDDDIGAARRANITGIRVTRPSSSSNASAHNDGAYGEIVLLNSDR